MFVKSVKNNTKNRKKYTKTEEKVMKNEKNNTENVTIFKRQPRLYDPAAVDEYIAKALNSGDVYDEDVIPGGLIDTYILYYYGDIIEVFEETYINCYSSAYKRHIYRKGLPKRYIEELERLEEEEAAEY